MIDRIGVGLLLFVASSVACSDRAAGQEDVSDEIERRVEELLPEAARLSGLEVREPARVRLASRDTLERFLLDRLAAEYPGDSLASIELAYRTFGLLPERLDLRELLVELLLEQAVGYYDPIRDILYVRTDEVTSDDLDGVIVHELVHALQDQSTDLDSLLRSQGTNDSRTAAQAAVEGHATVSMMAYSLSAITGRSASVGDLPELSPEMSAALVEASSMPRLAEAPAIVRETLLFSYLAGARYVQRLWRSRADRPLPLGEWLPASTEQLLHTERLLEVRDEPTPLEVRGDPSGWDRRYASDLGELEIRIYFEEHLADRADAARAAAGWDGDAYGIFSGETGGDSGGGSGSGSGEALVWCSVWDSEADADEFADAYRRAFRGRFTDAAEMPDGTLTGGGRRASVERIDLDGRPAVRVEEGGKVGMSNVQCRTSK